MIWSRRRSLIVKWHVPKTKAQYFKCCCQKIIRGISQKLFKYKIQLKSGLKAMKLNNGFGFFRYKNYKQATKKKRLKLQYTKSSKKLKKYSTKNPFPQYSYKFCKENRPASALNSPIQLNFLWSKQWVAQQIFPCTHKCTYCSAICARLFVSTLWVNQFNI